MSWITQENARHSDKSCSRLKLKQNTSVWVFLQVSYVSFACTYAPLYAQLRLCSSVTANKIHLWRHLRSQVLTLLWVQIQLHLDFFSTRSPNITVIPLHSIHACTRITATKKCHTSVSSVGTADVQRLAQLPKRIQNSSYEPHYCAIHRTPSVSIPQKLDYNILWVPLV